MGDIEEWMDESYIANIFNKTGSVTKVKIIKDKTSGKPLGYGFVEFSSHETAEKVLQLFNGVTNPATNT